MASGVASSLKVATIATICIMTIMSSSPGLAQRLCSSCDSYCNSCGGGYCPVCNQDPNSSNCTSCQQTFSSKCKMYCLDNCRKNCTSG
ncbi:hypothetical protein ACP70R_024224 [Stipagrostis hirtigluma subsp. patula]